MPRCENRIGDSMNLTKNLYDAFKTVVMIESRFDSLSQSVGALSAEVKSNNERVTARLENHAERLARLEGKFELVETSLGARRRKLPE